MKIGDLITCEILYFLFRMVGKVSFLFLQRSGELTLHLGLIIQSLTRQTSTIVGVGLSLRQKGSGASMVCVALTTFMAMITFIPTAMP